MGVTPIRFYTLKHGMSIAYSLKAIFYVAKPGFPSSPSVNVKLRCFELKYIRDFEI